MADFETVRAGTLEYERCAAFPEGAVHGFTTRLGGVSEGCLASLNLGTSRGDDPKNVLKNYEILGNVLGFDPEDVVFTRQTHTDTVARVGRENRGEGLFRPVDPERDGLITDEPGVVLTIFGADCTPVLFYDPVRRAIGERHAGWRGMAAGIPTRTVEAMVREFGRQPRDIRAAIGPCIGACRFETHEDVPKAMLEALGEEARPAIRGTGPKYHVDLKALAAIWSRKAGLCHFFASEDCTACQPRRYWSHRIVGNERGSQAAVIMLK